MYGHGGDFLGFFSEMQGYPAALHKRCGRLSSQGCKTVCAATGKAFRFQALSGIAIIDSL
jgi:hypothetical protein